MKYFLKLQIIILTIVAVCGLSARPQSMDSKSSQEKIDLGFKYAENGEYEKAIELLSTFVSDSATSAGSVMHPLDKLIITAHIGRCYKATNDNDRALQYLLKADSLCGRSMPIFYKYVLPYYTDIIDIYTKINKRDIALDWGRKWLGMTKRSFGDNSKEAAECYLRLFSMCIKAGDQAQAAKYLKQFIKIGNLDDYEEEDALWILNLFITYSELCYNLNQVDESIEFAENFEKLFSQELYGSKIHLRCLNDLFVFYSAVNPQIAELYLEKALSIIEGSEDEEILNSQEAYNAFNNLALSLQEEDPAQAAEILQFLVASYEEKGLTRNIGYATTLNNLGLLYQPGSEEANEYFREAFDTMINISAADISQIITLGHNLLVGLSFSGDEEEMIAVVGRIQERLSEALRGSFKNLTEKERTLYWNQVKAWYQIILPEIAVNIDNPALWGLFYDGLLQSRSILLSSTRSLKTLIEESNDENLKRLYSQYSDMSSIEAHSIMASLEERLLSESKKYGDFMDQFQISHADIMNTLKDDEVAIEFVRYEPAAYEFMLGNIENLPVFDNQYYALVQPSNQSQPTAIKICNEQDLKNWSLKSLYSSVWKPIESYLAGKHRVYFSPDGDLFSLPIECAQDSDGKSIGEKVAAFRVSSTREAVPKNNITDGNGVVLFGGMQYDLSVDEMKKDADRYRDVTEEMVKERGTRAELKSTQPLPGAEKEVIAINGLLATNSKLGEGKLYSGKIATEAAFKSYSGRRPKILHIATHGFYNSDNPLQNNVATTENEILEFERNAMTHSGLLFAGADNVRFDEPIPAEIEDGVLNAYEISEMNLHGTDIVVLSACRTGLGEVSGDGVFGLQRGFKKAGVNAILMSLWNVDDDATCAFMEEFYRSLMANYGKEGSKRIALEDARNFVKAQPQWSRPYYWAAFILLDGI